MSAPGTAKTHLEVGYVSRAHGLAGEVAVRTFDPSSDALGQVQRLLVRPRTGKERELRIGTVRPANKEVLVHFKGVQGRVAAEALVGATLLAFRDDLPPPEEGEFFQGDLVGLRAETEDGRPLGTVTGLLEAGEVPNLIITAPDGAEQMVPFADEFVPTVDLAGGRVVVRPLDLSDAGAPPPPGAEPGEG